MMKPQITDTSKEMEEYQIERLRNLSPGEKLEIVNSLTQAMWKLSWENFSENHKELNLEERKRKFFRLLYGDKIKLPPTSDIGA